ncbi:unnamed protein product [Pedinophyceae sp. YPF-701]|nr:unnamed protein product [Pedinophyceae sp. YPF-701]
MEAQKAARYTLAAAADGLAASEELYKALQGAGCFRLPRSSDDVQANVLVRFTTELVDALPKENRQSLGEQMDTKVDRYQRLMHCVHPFASQLPRAVAGWLLRLGEQLSALHALHKAHESIQECGYVKSERDSEDRVLQQAVAELRRSQGQGGAEGSGLGRGLQLHAQLVTACGKAVGAKRGWVSGAELSADAQAFSMATDSVECWLSSLAAMLRDVKLPQEPPSACLLSARALGDCVKSALSAANLFHGSARGFVANDVDAHHAHKAAHHWCHDRAVRDAVSAAAKEITAAARGLRISLGAAAAEYHCALLDCAADLAHLHLDLISLRQGALALRDGQRAGDLASLLGQDGDGDLRAEMDSAQHYVLGGVVREWGEAYALGFFARNQAGSKLLRRLERSALSFAAYAELFALFEATGDEDRLARNINGITHPGECFRYVFGRLLAGPGKWRELLLRLPGLCRREAQDGGWGWEGGSPEDLLLSLLEGAAETGRADVLEALWLHAVAVSDAAEAHGHFEHAAQLRHRAARTLQAFACAGGPSHAQRVEAVQMSRIAAHAACDVPAALWDAVPPADRPGACLPEANRLMQLLGAHEAMRAALGAGGDAMEDDAGGSGEQGLLESARAMLDRMAAGGGNDLGEQEQKLVVCAALRAMMLDRGLAEGRTGLARALWEELARWDRDAAERGDGGVLLVEECGGECFGEPARTLESADAGVQRDAALQLAMQAVGGVSEAVQRRLEHAARVGR